jgi:hypothetical protein
METRQFHLGDILSISHERLVSPRHIGGVYDILNFMTGDNLFTHQLPRASRECKPWLLRQLPFLATPEITRAVDELGAALDLTGDKGDREKVVKKWLAGMVKKYGKTHPVQPIPPDDHDRVNPITELEEMAGKDRVIVVEVPKNEG